MSSVQVLSHSLTCIFDGNSSLSACAPGSGSTVCRVQSSVKVHHMALWHCITSPPQLCVWGGGPQRSCHIIANCCYNDNGELFIDGIVKKEKVKQYFRQTNKMKTSPFVSIKCKKKKKHFNIDKNEIKGKISEAN